MATQAYQAQTKRLDEMKQNLQNVLDSFQEDPEKIAEALAFKSRFWNYSLNNSILIQMQNPYASFVASLHDWNAKGYRVKKGQHGIKVLFPIRTELIPLGEVSGRKRYRRVVDASPDEKKKVKSGELKTVTYTRFGVGTVFDISQTDCPPQDYPKLYSMGYSSYQHKVLYDAVKEYAGQKGIPVKEEDLESISLRGAFYPKENVIRISDRLNDTERLSTLTHELGHALMHNSLDTRELPEPVKELEADAVSIMLQQYFGIPLTDSRKRHFSEYYKACAAIGNFRLEDALKLVNTTYQVLRKELEPVLLKSLPEITKEDALFYGLVERLDDRGSPIERFFFTSESEYRSFVDDARDSGDPINAKKLTKEEYQKETGQEIQRMLEFAKCRQELKYDQWPAVLKENLEYVTSNIDLLDAENDVKDYQSELSKDNNTEKWTSYIDSAKQRVEKCQNKIFLLKQLLSQPAEKASQTEVTPDRDAPQKSQDKQEGNAQHPAKELPDGKTEGRPPVPSHNSYQQKREEHDNAVLNYIKRDVPLIAVAQALGFTPVQEGRYYTLKEHDSVKIYPETNSFFQFSAGKGGSPIDFLMVFGGYTAKEAIEKLEKEYTNGRFDEIHAVPQKPPAPVPEKKEFVLPEKVEGKYTRAFAYLTKTRCLDADIVKRCMSEGLIYEDSRHNVVFVGKDDSGQAVYATRHTTLTESSFKRDVAGSRQDVGWMVRNGQAEKLYVCEAPIDALSIMTLLKQQGKAIAKASFLATCGTCKDAALYARLRANPQIKEVSLANDNDEAGQKANEKIYKALQKDFPGIRVKLCTPNTGKDVNECLCKKPKKEVEKGQEVER